MKRAIMWCVCWSLYGFGDLVSRLIVRFDFLCNFGLYQVYNHCMIWSCAISDKYDFNVWGKSKEGEVE